MVGDREYLRTIIAKDKQIAALTARLAERDAQIAALREACTVAMGYIVRSGWKGTDARKALLALEVGCNPAPPTAAPLAAAEREVIEAAEEVVHEGDHAWREHGGDTLALGTHMQYFVLPTISRLRRMLDTLRAARGEASDD